MASAGLLNVPLLAVYFRIMFQPAQYSRSLELEVVGITRNKANKSEDRTEVEKERSCE